MEDARRQKVEAARQTLAKYKKKKTKQAKIPQTKDESGEVAVNETLSTITGQDDETDSTSHMLHGETTKEFDHISGIFCVDETLTDQQSLVGSLVEENERLKAQVSVLESAGKDIICELPVPGKEVLDSLESYSNKLKEFEEALACRDEVIGVLSSNLRKMTENRDTLQADYTTQANQLMQQVHLLQQQLKQAGNWLHLQDHNSPAQALLEAKNELLALHDNCRQKENQLIVMQNLIHERDTYMQQLIVRFNESTRDFAQIHEENRKLKERLETAEAEVVILQTERNALEAEKKEYTSMLHELHADSGSVEKESAKLLLRLQQENEVLRRKDEENTKVVQQLMADVESQHRVRDANESKNIVSIPSEISYSKEELEIEVEKQISKLRAELDEIYGTEIGRMKEHLQDKHRGELERLSAELKHTTDEKNRFSGQVNLWQQQYVRLSQQNVSSTDLVEQLSVVISENIHQKQLIEELRTSLKMLTEKQVKGSVMDEQKPTAKAVDLDKTDQADLRRLQIEGQNLRQQMNAQQEELSLLKSVHNEDLTRVKCLESELDYGRKELAKAMEKYSCEMESFQKEAADDIERLGVQLSESQKQVQLLESQVSDLKVANEELARLKEQLSRMQLDHTQQVATLKIEYEKYVVELKSYHEAEIETVTQQHTWKMNELKSTIKTQQEEQQDLMQKQLEEVTNTYEAQLENFSRQKEEKDVLQQEVTLLKSQMQEMRECLQQEHSRELLKKVEEVKLKYEQMISSLRYEHECIVAQLNDQLSTTSSQKEILAHTLQSPEAERLDAVESLQRIIDELNAKLKKVTKERDSAMQSLQTVYSDRIEMKQTLDQMNLEKEHLLVKMDKLAEERQFVESHLSAVCLERDNLRHLLDKKDSGQAVLTQKATQEVVRFEPEFTAKMLTVRDQLKAIETEKKALQHLLLSNHQDRTASHFSALAEPSDASQYSLVDQLRFQFEDLKLRYSQEIKESKEYQVVLLERLEILLQDNDLLREKNISESQNKCIEETLMLTKQLDEFSKQCDALSLEVENKNQIIAELQLAVDYDKKEHQCKMETLLQENEGLKHEAADTQRKIEDLKRTYNVGEKVAEMVNESTTHGQLLDECYKNVETLGENVSVSSLVYVADGGNGEGKSDLAEFFVLKQEYALVCAELLRLREMLYSLQNVNKEREDVRVEFEKQIALLREELLQQTAESSSVVTQSLEEALMLKEAEIQDLKTQLSKALTKLNELLVEREAQRSNYEHELDQMQSEHAEALCRIDALVQEHNIMFQDFGGPSALHVSTEMMPQLTDQNIEEEPSPRKIVYETQSLEIKRIRNELLEAHVQIESVSAENSRLQANLEASSMEFLKNIDEANAESKKEKKILEEMLATLKVELTKSNYKVECCSLEQEQLIDSHRKELEQAVSDHEAQATILTNQVEEANAVHELELSSLKKRLAEVQNEVEVLQSDKTNLEQEFIAEMQNTYKEHDNRIKTVRESYECEIGELRLDLSRQADDLSIKLEELEGFRQQNVSLVSQLEQLLQERDWTYRQQMHQVSPEATQTEKETTLLLRLDIVDREKAELKNELDLLKQEFSSSYDELQKARIANEVLRMDMTAVTAAKSEVEKKSDDSAGITRTERDENEIKTIEDSVVEESHIKNVKTLSKKIRSLQMEKELLASMVERLNREKDQLISYLVTRSQIDQAYEMDMSHLDLQPTQNASDGSSSVDSRDQRLKSLETEKELLVGMLEKLSQENEKLTAHFCGLDLSESDHDSVGICGDNAVEDSSHYTTGDTSVTETGEKSAAEDSAFFLQDELDSLRKENERLHKKEKSTDCDSELIPLLCVHG